MATNAEQATILLFVHVPKCAGTTLRHIVQRQYLGQALFVIHHDIEAERKRWRALGEQEKRKTRVVFGHMAWGWHEDLPPGQPHAYITMLRDPVERVLSLYAHARLKEHYLGPACGRMGLHEFLTSGVTQTADNGMVRQLCGRDAFLQVPWRDMAIPFRQVTRSDLGAAKRNLESCAVVGVSEQFDRFLDRMQERYAWRLSGSYVRENVTRWPRPDRNGLDRATLAALEEATALDRELYELAVRLAGGQG